ncbi:lytic transglycosylase domain-containing protein [Ferrovibrio sp.]|uniref:lytic transglycosylase domain-containing protein n=1 Tax=Ferrovibrio sp. TaxID=1917215 RepID=UPI00311D5DAB
MAALKQSVLAGLALAVACIPAGTRAQTEDDPIGRWQPFIIEAAARFGIPQAWIKAVMQAESGGRTVMHGQPITSKAGALGLMQLMPETYAEMRERHGLGTDPQEPRDNILAGTAYLRAMQDRFGYPGLFAAYNAGPARYRQHLSTGEVLPKETISYLAALDARVPPGGRLASKPPSAGPLKPVNLAAASSLFFVQNGARLSETQATPFVLRRSR